MAAKIILTSSDVDFYRKISAQYNSDKFNAFAFDCQQVYLRELLGDALYYELYNDLDVYGVPQNSPYTELVDGETFSDGTDTIIYFGLKPFLAYHWLKKALIHGDQFFADYGNISFSDNPQDHMQKQNASEKRLIISDFDTAIISYRNNIVEYLNEKSNTFDKWEGKREDLNKGSFTFFTN